MTRVLPSRALLLLLGIGLVDLLLTAVLHAQGRIVELNPIMRIFIERSEWLFAGVKGMTLVAAYLALIWYWPQNPKFCRQACLFGSVAYLVIWSSWFFGTL